MRVLFLDLDGVCNSEAYFKSAEFEGGQQWGRVSFGAAQLDPKAIALLDRLVEEADCDIVISSAWRHIWRHEQIADMLEERGFQHADRIVGETKAYVEAEDPMFERGAEVRDWLAMERERREVDPEHGPVTSFVILDDSNEFDGELLERFVQTDWTVGLTEAGVQRAIEIFGREGT